MLNATFPHIPNCLHAQFNFKWMFNEKKKKNTEIIHCFQFFMLSVYSIQFIVKMFSIFLHWIFLFLTKNRYINITIFSFNNSLSITNESNTTCVLSQIPLTSNIFLCLSIHFFQFFLNKRSYMSLSFRNRSYKVDVDFQIVACMYRWFPSVIVSLRTLLNFLINIKLLFLIKLKTNSIFIYTWFLCISKP